MASNILNQVLHTTGDQKNRCSSFWCLYEAVMYSFKKFTYSNVLQHDVYLVCMKEMNVLFNDILLTTVRQHWSFLLAVGM